MSKELNLSEMAQNTFIIHENMMILHAKALACHCECLGMNAKNSAAVCAGEIVPYNDKRYGEAMEKWGLTDKKGNPTI